MPPLNALASNIRMASVEDMVTLGVATIPFTPEHDRTHFSWPPPGMHSVPSPLRGPPYGFLAGEPAGPPGDWWVTTAGVFVAGLGDVSSSITQQLVNWFSTKINPLVGVWSEWPIIYESGAGGFMRWLRSTVRGTLGGGVETWQCKIDWGLPGSDPDYTLENRELFATQLVGLWTDFFATPAIGNSYSNSLKMTEVGVAQVEQTSEGNSDGSGGEQTATETAWVMAAGTGQSGASTEKSLPFEVACCVTFRTSRRGASGRGRLYLPPFSVNAMQTTLPGCFSEGHVDASGEGIQTIFDAVKADSDLVPVVVSHRYKVLNEITSIDVGIVPDSQRRRRRSQDEARRLIWEAA